jgi:glycosyltransferase involved in cell wall biosynthesis
MINKIGIAISTFSSANTSEKRIEIIKKSLASVKGAKSTNIAVVVVNDGSINKKHLAVLDEFRDSFDFINFPSNKGISSAKNAGIKHLYDLGCDLMFIMDDDIHLVKGFDGFYVNAIQKSGIHHFCYKVPELNKHVVSREDRGGIKIIKTLQVNGAFFTLTRKLIDSVGYFKLLPYRYGHEHTEYTGRIIKMTTLCPGYVDVEDSSTYVKYIGLDDRSDNFPGINDDLIKNNSKAAFGGERTYVKYAIK